MIGKANYYVNYFLANNDGDGNNAFNKIKPSSRNSYSNFTRNVIGNVDFNF